MLAHYAWNSDYPPDARPFVDPTLFSNSSDWFLARRRVGCRLCNGLHTRHRLYARRLCWLICQATPRLKREGEESSKAPLLDTVPFAVSVFFFSFLLFDDQAVMHEQLHDEIISLLILTPIIHRLFNVIGYRLGLKSVPY